MDSSKIRRATGLRTIDATLAGAAAILLVALVVIGVSGRTRS
jgi:hypothetical protein